MTINKLSWINRSGLSQGIFWMICSTFVSNLGDKTIRLVSDLPVMQITFCRFFFGTLILLPIMLYKGKHVFVIRNKPWHCARVITGCAAISCWISGVGQASLPSVTTISFTCPIFILPLAYLFLGEKSNWKRILSVLGGFIGVLVIAFFEKNIHGEESSKILFFHPGVIYLFTGAVLFALTDVLNKKMLSSENFFSLLFYFCLGISMLSFIPAILVWKNITFQQTIYLFLLGMSGASLLYCVLKAASAADISAISPYKYIELITSMIMSYILFGEIIKLPTIIGACLIIPSAVWIAYCEI